KCVGCGIQELKNLNLLHRTLRISRLENVVDPQDARQANLHGKKHLDALMLRWSSHFDDSRNETIEKEVLDMMQPHHMLKELTIKSYGGMTFPAWVGDPSFSNMVLLHLENCKNCSSLPPLGLLESLKDLVVSGMSGLQSIGLEIYGDSCLKPFPSLETLHFESNPEWKIWHVPDGMLLKGFPRLRKISILNCSKLLGELPKYLPSLEELVISKCESLRISISSFPLLNRLDINGCKEVVLRSVTEFSSLNSAVISGVLNFRCLWEFIQGARKVEHLEIVDNEDLSTLWPDRFGLLGHLTSLRCLKIRSCSGLVSLVTEEVADLLQLAFPCRLEILHLSDCKRLGQVSGLQCLTSLGELHIVNCSSLVSLGQSILPSTLKKLRISCCDKIQCLLGDGKDEQINGGCLLEHLCINSCPSLRYLSSTGMLPAPLRHLEITDCPELCSLAETFFGNISLEHIEIRNCATLASLPVGMNMLSNLLEITICSCPNIASFPEGGIHASKLRKLYIGWCERLQTLPEGMQNLTSLVELDIHDCPGIVSFPEKGLPVNLRVLMITNLNICKSLFEWGLHRLTSLGRLFITGGCENMVSFPEEDVGMTLPNSLTSLSIVDFPNLQCLSTKGFRDLNSLEDLWISGCPKLKSLPRDGLPPSLLQLYIQDCPLLKRKCKLHSGKEFSKISHIPCVLIDNNFIYDPEDEE
ncbi:hypothetical protein Tsubulata_028026, partial [Turnera subulata]